MKGTVVVHGGAGEWGDRLGSGVAGCEKAALAGAHEINSALDAAVAAVVALERDSTFNAGLGSTLTRDGTVELDAACMTGDLRFGAVGACPPVESAIRASRAIYDDGEHALMVGERAAEFAESAGIRRLSAGDLVTERARRRLDEIARKRESGDVEVGSGTVGAVAVDASGNLAAATSTGGIIYKRSGRVGDTPLPGAGTYADSELGGAASATGKGEALLRALVCREAVGRLRAEGPEMAAKSAIELMSRRVDGQGGLILIDADGDFVAIRNTKSMPWAAATEEGLVTSGS